MTLYIRVTQETLEDINLSDTMILSDIIKDINETTLSRILDFRDINKEAQSTQKQLTQSF